MSNQLISGEYFYKGRINYFLVKCHIYQGNKKIYNFKKYYVHNLPLLVSPLYIPTYIHPQSLPTSQNPLFECASLSLYPSFSVFLIRTQLNKYRL